MRDLTARLRDLFGERSALQLARVAPAALLASGTGVALAAMLGVPGFVSTAAGIIVGGIAVNLTSTWLEKLVSLPLEAEAEREETIQAALAANDPAVQRLVAAVLAHAAPQLAAALPQQGRPELIAGLERAMREAGGPLTALAPGYAAALQAPERADWAGLLSEAKRQISVQSTIEAGDDALIERSGHRVEAPPGPVVTTTRAGKGGRIIDSPISIIGAAPTQQAPPTQPAPQPARSPDSVSLELAVSRDGPGYSATARVSRPDSQADVSSPPVALTLDEAALRALSLDAEAYGAALSAGLFSASPLRDTLLQAIAAAQALRAPLRLQLHLDPAAPALHALRWETLRHPLTGAPLLTSQQVWCSRYLGSTDWAPVDLPGRATLRALGLVAAPTDLGMYNLAELDGTAAVTIARTALSGFDTGILGPGSATVGHLGAALRRGCDVLYLYAHGAMVDGAPRLWLERDDGRAAVIDGNELALRIGELARKPLLMVLLSCQSAGRGADEVAAALGPRLVATGVPAVMAMQGNLSLETAATFAPALFAALKEDGRIDRAVTEARAAVRDRPDWWAPALFTRLREGRIWGV